jgi:hypothetical protein
MSDQARALAPWLSLRCASERLSNQVSNNRHHQQWTSTDADGQSFPGQARRSARSPHRNLASGRRGRISESPPSK